MRKKRIYPIGKQRGFKMLACNSTRDAWRHVQDVCEVCADSAGQCRSAELSRQPVYWYVQFYRGFIYLLEVLEKKLQSLAALNNKFWASVRRDVDKRGAS